MSLIHDALRKAGEENDQRHGGHGRPASWRDVGPLPPRPRGAVWPWVTAGLAMIVGLAGLVWLAARPGAVPDVAQAAAVTASAQAPATPATPEPAVEKVSLAPVEALAPEKAPVAALPPPVEPAAAAPLRKPAAVEAPPPAPVAPPPAAAAGPPGPKMIAPPAQTGQVADDTYVLEAQVDGKELKLDFIVWSGEPFAQINGRQVGIGQQVEGFLVTAITRDRVTLETPTRRLMLKVR